MSEPAYTESPDRVCSFGHTDYQDSCPFCFRAFRSRIRSLAHWEVPEPVQTLRTRLACIGAACHAPDLDSDLSPEPPSSIRSNPSSYQVEFVQNDGSRVVYNRIPTRAHADASFQKAAVLLADPNSGLRSIELLELTSGFRTLFTLTRPESEDRCDYCETERSKHTTPSHLFVERQ